MSLLRLLASLHASAQAPAPAAAGPLVPLAYPPGTVAGNEARFYALSLHVQYAPGPEDARPLEVATCPDRTAMVPIPTALAGLKHGLAAAGLELKVEGESARLVAFAPPAERAPYVLVLPLAPAQAAVAALGAKIEPVDGGTLVVSAVERRSEVEKALCPAPSGADPAP